MQTPAKQRSPKLTTPKAAIIFVALVAVAGLLWAGTMFYKKSPTTQVINDNDLGQDAIRQIENGLVQAGAIKKCTIGDNGHGTDNTSPWHKAYYQLMADKQQAISLITKVAADSGFALTHASVDNRGPVGVADQFIDAWYFNDSTKHSYSELEPGTLRLMMTVNADGANKACGKNIPIIVDSAHSVVSVEAQLPAFKR